MHVAANKKRNFETTAEARGLFEGGIWKLRVEHGEGEM